MNSGLPRSREQARKEGWRYVCHSVDLGPDSSPDGVLFLAKDRRRIAIPFTTIEQHIYRFEEAELVSPDAIANGISKSRAKRKWFRKSEKLMQLGTPLAS